MPTRNNTLSLLVGLSGLVAMLCVGSAQATDNSEIVIIDQQHRATPFGRYDSQRKTRIYGPASGFRYEEYRTPVQPVYPRYRHYYGDRHRGEYGGRVFEHRGPNGYSRHAAPSAPRFHGYGHDNTHGSGARRRGEHHRQPATNNRRRPGGRVIEPAQRAIQPSGRAIDNDRH